jgi:hypothetical protein
MMEKLELNPQAAEFVEKYFQARGILYSATVEGDIVCMKFEDTGGIFEETVIDTLIYFYKYKEIMREFSLKGNEGLAFYAFIGAVLSLDKLEHIETIKKELENQKPTNLDGLYNFKLEALYKGWGYLARLSKKLYGQCTDSGQVAQLAIFMLGVDGMDNGAFTIYPNGKIKCPDSDTFLTPYPLTSDFERDIMITVMAQNPTDIVISDTHSVTSGFIDTIKALGD